MALLPLSSGEAEAVEGWLDELLAGNPRRHLFEVAAAAPAIAWHMSVTGLEKEDLNALANRGGHGTSEPADQQIGFGERLLHARILVG